MNSNRINEMTQKIVENCFANDSSLFVNEKIIAANITFANQLGSWFFGDWWLFLIPFYLLKMNLHFMVIWFVCYEIILIQ